METEAHLVLRKDYGDAALSKTTFPDRFSRFKHGDFDVDDRLKKRLPKTCDYADLESLID